MLPGSAIAAALGLDVDRLRKFTITAEAGSNLPIVVEAEYILDELDESGENLLTELRRYELTEVT